MNIFEYCHPDNNYNNDSFGSFLSKNRIFCSVNLHFMKVSTEIDNNFGYEKITQLVDNIPLSIIDVIVFFSHKTLIRCHFNFSIVEFNCDDYSTLLCIPNQCVCLVELDIVTSLSGI